jgi:hypothetical protein
LPHTPRNALLKYRAIQHRIKRDGERKKKKMNIREKIKKAHLVLREYHFDGVPVRVATQKSHRAGIACSSLL